MNLTRRVSGNSLLGYRGAAGAGSSAGLGAGGGISSASILTVLGSSLARNTALGHNGQGGASGGSQVGVYNRGTFLFDPAAVIAHNHAADGNGDIFGSLS